jgi:hypothetical protein
LAGHRFVVFPSGWHDWNNTRTFQIGKPRRTTSCAAGSKGISLCKTFGLVMILHVSCIVCQTNGTCKIRRRRALNINPIYGVSAYQG